MDLLSKCQEKRSLQRKGPTVPEQRSNQCLLLVLDVQVAFPALWGGISHRGHYSIPRLKILNYDHKESPDHDTIKIPGILITLGIRL